MIRAEIITIGDELLIGQVIDTNSAWIAKQLNAIGIDVEYKTTVGDTEADILDAFERALSRASVILVTGGIGPTKDDITKKTLCKFFKTQLVFDPDTLKTVKEVVRSINRELNELTRQQAYVPQGATIIQNKMGTAPVTWFERDGKVLVSMPGVPYEMKWAMTHELVPRLRKAFPLSDSIRHQVFWVKGYSESMLAIHLNDFEENLPDYIKLAYLPTSGLIRLRLTGKHSDKDVLEKQMEEERIRLLNLLPGDIVSEEDKAFEEILHDKLIEEGLTLGLAESCTGGRLASLFTAQAGSSAYLKGGVVSYSNEAKIDILGVDPAAIEQFGAVSFETVEQMSLGAQRIFGSDCSIATSGIAGPTGGTDEKPIGTVYIAVRCKDQYKAEVFHFTTNRETNILRSCNAAMSLLLEML